LRTAFNLFLLACLCVVSWACEGPFGTTDVSQRVRVTHVTYQELAGGARILKGDLENLSAERIAVAQIDVSLYDASNRKVESLMIVVRDIEPSSTVSFREPVRSVLDIRGAKARAVFLP